MGNPTGGPASSPWTSGGGMQSPSPVEMPSPPPPPIVDCRADIFNECFSMCSGVLGLEIPGIVCGWVYSTAAGGTGGSINFSPGHALFLAPDNSSFPAMTKPLPLDLLSVFGLTVQFFFTESIGNSAIQFMLSAKNNVQQLVFRAASDGTISVKVGNTASLALYTGAWTSHPGTDRKVALVINGAGVPTLTIDGVSIPLTFSANQAGAVWPPNAVSMLFTIVPNLSLTTDVQKFFVSSGSRASDTFCCI